MTGWILAAAALGYIGGLATLAALAWYWSRRDMRKIGAAAGNKLTAK